MAYLNIKRLCIFCHYSLSDARPYASVECSYVQACINAGLSLGTGGVINIRRNPLSFMISAGTFLDFHTLLVFLCSSGS